MIDQPELVAFLNSRFDEEEQAARLAGDTVGYSWTAAEGTLIINSGKPEGSNYVNGIFFEHGEEALHIALQSPERVLLKVESCRKLVRYAADDLRDAAAHQDPDSATGPLETLKTIASAYTDHPDYLPDWRTL